MEKDYSMLSEENVVEVVQRNLIMLRNTNTEDRTIRRQIFSLSTMTRHMKLNTSYGIGIRKLIEVCEIADCDVSELFYIDPSWDFEDRLADPIWKYNDMTKVRYFKPFYPHGVHEYDCGEFFYEKMMYYIENEKTSKGDWYYALSEVIVNQLKHNPETINFSSINIARINQELAITPDELFSSIDYNRH